MIQLDARSERNLTGVKSDLVAVVRRAHEIMDGQLAASGGLSFIVIEGLRTSVRQAELVRAGASWTMKSKHLTGDAVDLAATVNGEVRWDWALYDKLASAVKAAAKELDTPIVWGGDWKKRDGPHFELAVRA